MRLTAFWPLLPLLVIYVSSRVIKQNPRHRQLLNRISNRDDPPSYHDVPRGKSIEKRIQRQGQWLEYRKPPSSPITKPSIHAVYLAEYRTHQPEGEDDDAGAQSHKANSHYTQAASSLQAINEWLKVHDEARAQHGAGTVQWNETLATGARINAQRCDGKHTYIVTSVGDAELIDSADKGENIASNSKSMSPQVAVDQWMGNAKLYNGKWQGMYTTQSTAHYTQMIWKSTTQIGCHIQECAPGTRYDAKYGTSWQATCRYNPAGNDVTTEKGFWVNTHS